MPSNEYIEFELLGELFKIKSDVPKDYFLNIVNYLKEKLVDMKQKLPTQSNIKLLTFVTLDIIDELFRIREQSLNKDTMEKLTTLSEHLASVIDDIDLH